MIHVGMVDDLLMEVDQQRESASDPVVILLADGHIHYSFLGVEMAHLGLLAVEGQVFEHQGNALAGLQEEGIVLADEIVSLWFCVVAG